VVLPHHLAAGVRNAPTLPVAGINLIQQIIRTEIETSRAYNQRCEVLLEKIVLPFLQPIYQSLEHIRSDRWFQDTLSLVFDAVMPAISPIREMLRYNPYQMCVVQHHEGFQLRVDQLGDYRIMEWERITNDIDYRRWMHLKSNGDWDRYVREQEKSNGDWDRYGVSNNNY
jgi:hypothetical protein